MSSQVLVRPRWCTPRDESAPTYGPAVVNVAAAMGATFLPWQDEAAHTIGEVRPDGRMVFPIVILLVPRRGGKTYLTLPTLIQRASCAPDQRCWYTAQSQSDAEETFRDDWVPLATGPDSALKTALRKRLSNGSMRFTLSTGGKVGVFAPTEKALHGKHGDAVVIDEAWAFDALRGQHIEAAVRPTMATRPLRQLFIISAGGTEDSTWLLHWRKLGRALVESGRCREAGVFYLECYPPGELDDSGELADLSVLDDPELWAATHPSVGHTIPLDTLVKDRETMDPALFYRSYLNVFTSSAMTRLLPTQDVQACMKSAAGLVLPARPVIGYDVEHDRSGGAITAVGMREDGRLHMELRWTGAVELMADQLQALHRKGYRLVADGLGPSLTVTAELVRRGVRVDTLDTREAVTGAAELVDRVTHRTLVITPEERVSRAMQNVGKRDVGDGYVLTRKGSGPDVSPVTAAAPALLRALKRPVKSGAILVAT